MCRYGLCEFLENSGIIVIWEINPYFLFFRGTQMRDMGGKPQMGDMAPLTPSWYRPWFSCLGVA